MTERPKVAEPIDVSALGSAREERRIVASDAARADVAEAWGVLEVPQLAADLILARRADGAIAVTGTVKAVVVQECVVSFQPVRQEIEELIDSVFADQDRASESTHRPGAEIHIDVAAETPEPLKDGFLDVSAVILGHAALAIAPYPRAEGAEIPEEYAKRSGSSEESPFAQLSQLVDPQNRKSD